jgi:hypothetical protein
MAKQLIGAYTYSKSGKTITLTDWTTVRLDRILLIVDATINTIMYNFADSTVATATVATNVITLSAVPSSSADADKLLIFYDTITGDTSYDDTTLRKAATGTTSAVASSASSVTLLSATAGRKKFVIYNDSTQILYVKYGTTASATDFTWYVGPGMTLEDELYTGRVDGIWASANGNARCTSVVA